MESLWWTTEKNLCCKRRPPDFEAPCFPTNSKAFLSVSNQYCRDAKTQVSRLWTLRFLASRQKHQNSLCFIVFRNSKKQCSALPLCFPAFFRAIQKREVSRVWTLRVLAGFELFSHCTDKSKIHFSPAGVHGIAYMCPQRYFWLI